MITVWRNGEDSECRIQARGNFSLDANGLAWLLVALSAVTFCLAAFIAWQGYWPVLAFAVVQIVLVGWIFIRVWKRAWIVETIEIRHDRIDVIQQRHRRRCRHTLDAAWAVVELRPPEISWYAPRLMLRSGTKRLELGSFLTGEEKRELVVHLKTAIAKHSVLTGAH